MKKYPFHWLLLLLTVALWQWLDSDDSADISPLSNGRPDFIANRLYSISYNEQGLPEYRVYAKRMDYFSEQSLTVFDEPQILVYPNQDLPIWQIQADQAKVLQQQTVALENQVKVKNLSRDEYVKYIATDYLEIDLNKQTMQTQRPVYIQGPAYMLEGEGMVGNLKSETVNLLNDVNAVYQVQP